MYELIYRNRIIARNVYGTFVVGDSYCGLYVWEVDYRHKIVYLCD